MNSSCATRSFHRCVGTALILAFAAAWPSSAAPIITATKDDNLAAGLRKLPGNTITYTTTISNTGDATASAVQFADPDPANTTFVSVNSTPSRGPIVIARLGMCRSPSRRRAACWRMTTTRTIR